MAAIKDIVINISKGTKGLSKQVFRPLIVGSDTAEITVEIVSELADLITAGYLSTDPEYLQMAAMLAQSPRPVDVAVYRKATATTYTDALDALVLTFTAFWGIVIGSRIEADLNSVGTWANSNKRFFFGGINDVDAGNARNLDREAYIIHDASPVEYPDGAIVGQSLPKQPGSFTFKWKQLSGISASGYTLTELNTVRSNNTQAMQEQAGAIYLNEGISTSGEFIDVIHGMDWVEDQLNVDLLSLMINNEKVPFDDRGIAQVEGVIRGVMKRSGEAGIIAAAVSEADMLKSDDKKFQYKVTVPRAADVTANDKANRELTGVEFIYYLAGAIHKTTITGLITL